MKVEVKRIVGGCKAAVVMSCDAIQQKTARVMGGFGRVMQLMVAMAFLAFLAVADVVAQVSLPDLGVDVAGHATAMGQDLGAGFMVILGIAAVFIAGGIMWRWLRRAKG